MSGGLTSYPRTGGGSGPMGPRFDRLIHQLSHASTLSLQTEADQLIRLLEQSLASLPAASVVTYARRAREALFIARIKGALAHARHVRAMELCAEAWKRQYALDATALKARSDAARQRLALHFAQAGTATELRVIKEEIGLIAWVYEASALLGEDLAAGVIAQASTYPNSRYVGARNASGDLTYLECAGAYNVNLVLRVAVPGVAEPMVLVGEAKGGKSGFGVVKTSRIIRQMGHLPPTLSQGHILYAPSRALYMRKAVQNWTRGAPPAHVVARQEAGHLIFHAYGALSLCYVTARGDATLNMPLDTKRVSAQCT